LSWNKNLPVAKIKNIYTEGGSKVGILTRRLLKIFRLERVTIAYGQGTSEDKNFDAKLTPSKTNF